MPALVCAGEDQARQKQRIAVATALVQDKSMRGHMQNPRLRSGLEKAGTRGIVAGEQLRPFIAVPPPPRGGDIVDLIERTRQRIELNFIERLAIGRRISQRARRGFNSSQLEGWTAYGQQSSLLLDSFPREQVAFHGEDMHHWPVLYEVACSVGQSAEWNLAENAVGNNKDKLGRPQIALQRIPDPLSQFDGSLAVFPLVANRAKAAPVSLRIG